jgi:hypothetical protein
MLLYLHVVLASKKSFSQEVLLDLVEKKKQTYQSWQNMFLPLEFLICGCPKRDMMLGKD